MTDRPRSDFYYGDDYIKLNHLIVDDHVGTPTGILGPDGTEIFHPPRKIGFV